MTKRRIQVVDSKILILGLTFKENCPDLRNTRVTDIIKEFTSYHANVEVHDPWVNKDEAFEEYGIKIIDKLQNGRYDAIVLAVSHHQFVEMGITAIRELGIPSAVVFDAKALFPRELVDDRL